MLLTACEHAARFCHGRPKAPCQKWELSGYSACLRSNGFAEPPDSIAPLWLCLRGGTKHLISSTGSLNTREQLRGDDEELCHRAER